MVGQAWRRRRRQAGRAAVTAVAVAVARRVRDGVIGQAWGRAVGRGRGVIVTPTPCARAGAYGTELGVRTIIRARRR